MTDAQLIHHMQVWLFRHAQTKWGKTPQETAELFKKYSLFEYVCECYDYLHLSSYSLALENLEAILTKKGVKI